MKSMGNSKVECVVDSQDSLGEGCLWDIESASVWWLDITRPSTIHCFTPATGNHQEWPSKLLLTAIAKKSTGGFILGGEDGVYAFDPATGSITPFCKPETNIPQNRFNDGACDPQGRFWIGTMMQNIGPGGEDLPITASTGNLFRVTADGKSEIFERNVGVSNGPCWSPDGGTFYFSDSMAQVTYAYDFDGVKGVISNRRTLNNSKDHGYPDGATVDAEGFVWSARWDGQCILRIDPKGRIDRIIETPCTRPTCVVFGGKDLSTLYFTSSRAHLDAATLKRFPHQGGLFAYDAGIRGTLKNRFAG
jgi:sugar lactone lactonase YvrE